MTSLFTLPALTGTLIASIAVGIHLGESTIGLINPIYFQAPPLHPRERGVAIDEARVQRAAPRYADLYGWQQGHAARAADCADCDALRARDAYAYSAEIPYFGGDSDLQAAVAESRSELGEEFAEVPEPAAPRYADVERYAHFQVAEKPAATVFDFKEPPPDAVEIAQE